MCYRYILYIWYNLFYYTHREQSQKSDLVRFQYLLESQYDSTNNCSNPHTSLYHQSLLGEGMQIFLFDEKCETKIKKRNARWE